MIEPGFYPMSEEAYFAIPAVNASLLKTVRALSPRHALHQRDFPTEDTPAMRIGRAVDTAILQPAIFEKRYVTPPNPSWNERRSAAAKQWWKEIAAAGQEPLTDKQYRLAQDMSRAAWSHPLARRLLEARGVVQGVEIWQEDLTLCKARLDKVLVLDGVSWIIDLKTTGQIGLHDFQRTASNFDYFMQLAWYRRGASKLYPGINRALGVLCIESEPPHDVVCYMPDNTDMTQALDEALTALRQWEECVKNERYPGIADGWQNLSYPRWRRGTNLIQEF